MSAIGALDEAVEEPRVVTYLTLMREGRAERTTAANMAWIGGASVLRQVVQFASSIVLVRLLTPADYGLTAIVWSIMGFANLFADLGLSGAVVQSKKLDERLLSTAFWLNLAASVTLGGLLAASSFLLAAFYDQQALVGLLCVSSLGFLFALSAVPNAVLERLGMFDVLAKVELSSAALGLAITIALAASGVGAMSLVVGPVVGTFYGSARLLWFCRWRPGTGPSRAAARELLGFGTGLALYNFSSYWSRNLDNLVLGRYVGTRDLGYYARAYNLMMLPVSQTTFVLGRVLFPVLSRHQDDVERLRGSWTRATTVSLGALAPAAIGLAACAPDFVGVVYGERWTGMVPVLVVLALAAPPQILAATTSAIYAAVGETQRLARRGGVSALVMIAGLAAGLPWGIVGAACGLLVAVVLTVPILMNPMLKRMETTWGRVIASLLGSTIASSVMAAVIVGIHLSPMPPGWRLLAELLVGAGTYVGALWVVDRPTARFFLDPVVRRVRRS